MEPEPGFSKSSAQMPAPQGFSEQHREDHLRQSAGHDFNTQALVSWNDANWRRMVNEFFLREINAHRCMRSNLSRGSASAMRMLRQEDEEMAQ